MYFMRLFLLHGLRLFGIEILQLDVAIMIRISLLKFIRTSRTFVCSLILEMAHSLQFARVFAFRDNVAVAGAVHDFKIVVRHLLVYRLNISPI